MSERATVGQFHKDEPAVLPADDFRAPLFQDLLNRARITEEIPCSGFQEAFREGRVSEIVVVLGEIRGIYASPADGESAFMTRRVDPD